MYFDGLKGHKLYMTNIALGFAHQVSQIFLTENNELSLIKFDRRPKGKVDQGSVFIPQNIKHCTDETLYSQRASKIPAKYAETGIFKILQKTQNSLH